MISALRPWGSGAAGCDNRAGAAGAGDAVAAGAGDGPAEAGSVVARIPANAIADGTKRNMGRLQSW
jgi:hypothetical protein